MQSTSRKNSYKTREPTIPMENYERTHHENPEEEGNKAPTSSKRQRTSNLCGYDFIMYLMDDTPSSISKACASPDPDY